MQFKLTPSPLDRGVGGEAGGVGRKILIRPCFFAVYSRLAANFIQKRVKRWRRSKTQEPNEQIIPAVPFFGKKFKILLVIMNYTKNCAKQKNILTNKNPDRNT